MNKIFKSKILRCVMILLAGILFLMFVVGVAFATTTPQRCDPALKYYCSKVTYTDQRNNVLITARAFRGAIDGGADKWQNWYTKDWERVRKIP